MSQRANRPIWQVKQRWAHGFNPTWSRNSEKREFQFFAATLSQNLEHKNRKIWSLNMIFKKNNVGNKFL